MWTTFGILLMMILVLLSFRAHYSVDIMAGIVYAHYIYLLVQGYDD